MTKKRPEAWQWHGWRAALAAGLGFCGLQVTLKVVRFGPRGLLPDNRLEAQSILSGLGLFFVAGVLAYVLTRGLLRGSSGIWRRALVVAAATATPLAVVLSLAGGLLGPAGVLIYALAPYLVLVGIPVLCRRLWQLVASGNRGA